MMKFKIKFSPDEKTVEAQQGDTILEAAQAAGVDINNVCGGDGVCGKCRVIVRKGDVNAPSTVFLTRRDIQQGYVLACLAKIESDLEVEVPSESRTGQQQILTGAPDEVDLTGMYSAVEKIEAEAGVEEGVFAHGPLATKIYLELPAPTLEDNISDLERLYRRIRKHGDIPIMQTGLHNLKKLGRLLRKNNWKVTALLGKRNETTEIVFLEAGNTAGRNYGIAVDVGTTTVVAHLIDLITRKTLGAVATHNQQQTYGDDIISRIMFAHDAGGLEKMHQAVVNNVNNLISALVAEHNVALNDVTAVMCAGNTTMTHLLLGIDPTYIRKEPYVATANFVPVIRSAEVDVRINPRGLLNCLPGVSSYVGGDIAAGTLASGIADEENVCMLIDVGTNGEIVMGNKEWLVCCSASAGPAFEGSGVTCGMRAGSGAVQKVDIDSDTYEVTYKTIDDTRAKGICGSGMIDIIAELLRCRIIDRAGRFMEGLKTDKIRKSDEGIKEFVVCRQKDADSSRDIVITQADISNLIRSKGAIYAGAAVLVQKMGLTFNDIDKFFIAGGFGNYLNSEKAVMIGLLPDLPKEKFRFIGNASITGAKMALLSNAALEKVDEIARKMTYIELSVDNMFSDQFVSALFLPHTDTTLFPTVSERMEF